MSNIELDKLSVEELDRLGTEVSKERFNRLCLDKVIAKRKTVAEWVIQNTEVFQELIHRLHQCKYPSEYECVQDPDFPNNPDCSYCLWQAFFDNPRSFDPERWRVWFTMEKIDTYDEAKYNL